MTQTSTTDPLSWAGPTLRAPEARVSSCLPVVPPYRNPAWRHWYGIPSSVWPGWGWVSPPGCAPSWILVKINPVLTKPRTGTRSFSSTYSVKNLRISIKPIVKSISCMKKYNIISQLLIPSYFFISKLCHTGNVVYLYHWISLVVKACCCRSQNLTTGRVLQQYIAVNLLWF